MSAAFEPEPVPLAKDEVDRLMVAGTRVPLDTLIAAFRRGESPEEIHEGFPTISLGDIYAVLTYCVRHQAEVNSYLAERNQQRAEIRAEAESRFPAEGLRERLLARLA